jgi:phosphopantothenoylcysteine decarboxylase/phosphopantothenate--cysteine ligase
MPMFVDIVMVESAAEMFEAVTSRADEQDIIIKAAAVADYTPATTADSKLKKSDSDMKIDLVRTKDILKTLGEDKREGQLICGFSMETDNVLENSRAKLEKKNCDMICANSLRTEGAGFGTDTNSVTVFKKSEVRNQISEVRLPLASKQQIAEQILEVIQK